MDPLDSFINNFEQYEIEIEILLEWILVLFKKEEAISRVGVP